MSKNLRFVLLFIMVLIGCSGCNGNITRDIRHQGFDVSDSSFVCKPLFPSKDEEKDYERIRYLSDAFAITNEGNIYELSLRQKFSNGQNCKKSSFPLIVESIFDNSVIKASDGKYYYLFSQSNVPAYSEVTTMDNNYSIYNLLLTDPDVLKVQTIDQNQGYYYVLRRDGSIYNYVVTRESYNSPYTLAGAALVYNKNDYNGKIMDFYEAFDNPATFIKTNKEIHRMQATNLDQCMKYADVYCKYKMSLDKVLTEHLDRILGYNGGYLITDYGKVFSASR